MIDFFTKTRRLVQEYAEKHDSDFVIYAGEMNQSSLETMINACRDRNRRTNITLMLATLGGDAAAAYRIGRMFQDAYNIGSDSQQSSENSSPEFNIFIPIKCKSAGTILALAGTKIIMSDLAELGPIDVQLRDPLEVGERTSGLTPIQAMQGLSVHSKTLFKDHFRQLRFDRQLLFTTGAAAQIATEITTGLMRAMYEQVDPIRLAEVERSLKISSDYAERLASGRSNLKDEAIDRLVGGYPSHGFVIDRKEAGELFHRIAAPGEMLEKIASEAHWLLEWTTDSPERGPIFNYLCTEKGYSDDATDAGGRDSEATRETGRQDDADN